MKQLIEEQRKDFDIWFKEYPGVPTIGEIQEWYEDRFKQFIDELIAREEKEIEKARIVVRGAKTFSKVVPQAFILAKNDIIDHLKKLKEELN